MQSDPADLGVLQAAAALRSRELSSAELTEACLQRIERLDGPHSFDGSPDAINAFIRTYPELAREQALAADLAFGERPEEAPLLNGIPLALKDLYGVAGLPITASSRVLEGNVADADATAWARLRDQGMVLLGHTHTHEFAAGGTTDQVGNPHDLTRVVGGSSGGSAAALAARMTPAALGSDTCGSLRIPSACCGTSAIKPTHGLVPIDGIIPLGPTLDHPGPMARTVADCAAVLSGMAGIDLPLTGTAASGPLSGVTVALTDRPDGTDMVPEVATALDSARRACEELGARVVTLPTPWTFDWDDLSLVLMTEVWQYHRHHAARHDRYRPSIAEFVELGENFTDQEAYEGAQRRRAEGTAAWEAWFAEHNVDVILEPTLPTLPPPRGTGYERGHAGGPGDPMIALTALWDMTGMPVATLPVSWDTSISLIARRGRERPLTQIAIDLQEHALGIPERP